jgi:hypothetical protein
MHPQQSQVTYRGLIANVNQEKARRRSKTLPERWGMVIIVNL